MKQILFLFTLAFGLSSCSINPTTGLGFKSSKRTEGKESNSLSSEYVGIIKKANLERAAKLAKQYEDEEIVIEYDEIYIEFFREDPVVESKTDKKESKKEKRKKSKEKVEAKKEEPKDTIAEKLKLAEKDLMATPVSVKTTRFQKALCIEDLSSFYSSVPYNQQEVVTNMKFTFKEDAPWRSPTIVDEGMDDGSIFYSDQRVKSTRIDLPILGTQLYYGYQTHNNNIKYLTSEFFHDNYRCLKKRIIVEVPEWLELEILEKNFEGFKITKTNQKPAKIESAEIQKQFVEGKLQINGRRKKSIEIAKKSDKLSYVVIEIDDLKPSEREPLAAGASFNLPHLLFLAKSFVNDKGETKKLLSETKDLYLWYRALVNLVQNDTANISTMAKKLTENCKTDKEKIEAVFYWVQENIRYIAFEDGIAGFKPESCNKVFESRYGDCKGMANLTAQMLKVLGYDTRLTWIGTNHIAYDYSIPSLVVDNHMICTVILDGKRYFLDPTEEFIEFGDYAHRIQGRPVMIEDGDSNYILDKIPDLPASRNTYTRREKLAISGNQLVGKVNETYKGESKTRLLRNYNQSKSDRRDVNLERFLTDENINVQISDVKHSGFNNRERNIDFSYDYVLHNALIKKDNVLFINPEQSFDYAGLDIDTSRLRDIAFSFKLDYDYETRISLPKGAKVENLPKALKTTHAYFIVSLSYEVQGNEIIYRKKISFPQAYLPKSAFAQWNQTRKQMLYHYNQPITISQPK